jgi:hypothetical protein
VPWSPTVNLQELQSVLRQAAEAAAKYLDAPVGAAPRVRGSARGRQPRNRPRRSLDTVDLLLEAVMYGDLDAGGALNLVNAIRNSGRSIRRVHPGTLLRDYFR